MKTVRNEFLVLSHPSVPCTYGCRSL